MYYLQSSGGAQVRPGGGSESWWHGQYNDGGEDARQVRGNTSQSILDTVITSHSATVYNLYMEMYSAAYIIHYIYLYNARKAVPSDIIPCIVEVSVSDVSEVQGDSAVLGRMIL